MLWRKATAELKEINLLHLTFNQGVKGSNPFGLTNNLGDTTLPGTKWRRLALALPALRCRRVGYAVGNVCFYFRSIKSGYYFKSLLFGRPF